MNERLAVSAIGAGMALFVAYQAALYVVTAFGQVAAAFAGVAH